MSELTQQDKLDRIRHVRNVLILLLRLFIDRFVSANEVEITIHDALLKKPWLVVKWFVRALSTKRLFLSLASEVHIRIKLLVFLVYVVTIRYPLVDLHLGVVSND